MALSDIELKRIDATVGALCRARTRPEFRDQLRFEYRVDGHAVVILEIRPFWRDETQTTEHGVAKLRYFRSRNEWQLYWMRADLKWHLYEPRARSARLEDLVEEVATDPYGCFFG